MKRPAQELAASPAAQPASWQAQQLLQYAGQQSPRPQQSPQPPPQWPQRAELGSEDDDGLLKGVTRNIVVMHSPDPLRTTPASRFSARHGWRRLSISL